MKRYYRINLLLACTVAVMFGSINAPIWAVLPFIILMAIPKPEENAS